jgi:hypothetical protein
VPRACARAPAVRTGPYGAAAASSTRPDRSKAIVSVASSSGSRCRCTFDTAFDGTPRIAALAVARSSRTVEERSTTSSPASHRRRSNFSAIDATTRRRVTISRACEEHDRREDSSRRWWGSPSPGPPSYPPAGTVAGRDFGLLVYPRLACCHAVRRSRASSRLPKTMAPRAAGPAGRKHRSMLTALSVRRSSWRCSRRRRYAAT